MSNPVTVAMRAHNDMPLLRGTLEAVAKQSVEFELIAFDNASSDGGRAEFERFGARVFDVPEGGYIPGDVLNRAMRESKSEIVVFLNADCEPLDEQWLAELIAPFADPSVAATFGRQMPRPGCEPLAAHDTEATFGDGVLQGAWRHCFSMASSAVRRSVWESVPFDESLGYSEDIAWSWQVRQAGHEIRYAASSRVYHSHNYTAQQWRRRQQGEGRAEAAIFSWTPWQRSLLRYSLLPTLKQMIRDVRYCARTRQLGGMLQVPAYRLAQMTGRREGFLQGLADQERARA